MSKLLSTPYAQGYYSPKIVDAQQEYLSKHKDYLKSVQASVDKAEDARIKMQNAFLAKNNTTSLGMLANPFQRSMQPLKYTAEDRLIISQLVQGVPPDDSLAFDDPRRKLAQFLRSFNDQYKINTRDEYIRLLQSYVDYFALSDIGYPPNPAGTAVIAAKLYNKTAGVGSTEIPASVVSSNLINPAAISIGQLTPTQKKKILTSANFLFSDDINAYIQKEIYKPGGTGYTEVGKLITNQPTAAPSSTALPVPGDMPGTDILLKDLIKPIEQKYAERFYDEGAVVSEFFPLWGYGQAGVQEIPTSSQSTLISDVFVEFNRRFNQENWEDAESILSNEIINNNNDSFYGWSVEPPGNVVSLNGIAEPNDYNRLDKTITQLKALFDSLINKYGVSPNKSLNLTMLRSMNKINELFLTFYTFYQVFADAPGVLIEKIALEDLGVIYSENRIRIRGLLQTEPTAPEAGPSTPAPAGPSVVDSSLVSDSLDTATPTMTPAKPDEYDEDSSSSQLDSDSTGSGLGKGMKKALAKEIQKIEAYKHAGGNNKQVAAKVAILRRMVR